MITKIHSFLVYPGKNQDEQHALHGIEIDQSDSRLFGMLNGVYRESDHECKIEIVFNTESQSNQTRDHLISYIMAGSLANARKIALRLQLVTTRRSGLGLLFLMTGKEGKRHKLVVARFPVEQGIMADESNGTLTVEFIDRIFLKNTHSYKSALYSDTALKGGMWDGRVVDKQVNRSEIDASQYWIYEFLDSDFKTTSARGTARLATVLREAVNRAKSNEAKGALISMATLAAALDGQFVSINGLCKKFNISDEAREVLTGQVRNKAMLDETFRFSLDEFRKHIQYHYWRTEEGVTVIAEEENWEQKVAVDYLDGPNSRRVRISTEGSLADERLRKGK